MIGGRGRGGDMIYGNKTKISAVLIRGILWKLKYCFNVPEKNDVSVLFCFMPLCVAGG